MHLVLLYCHLFGTRRESVWCPDASDAPILSWSCRKTSWSMQDTQPWRDGSAAEDHSSLSSTPLRCFIAPQERWSVMRQHAFPQHTMGPFHRLSAQDIQAFLTDLWMCEAFSVGLPLVYKNRRQAARTGHSFDLQLRADLSPCLYGHPLSLLGQLSCLLIWAISYLIDQKYELWPLKPEGLQIWTGKQGAPYPADCHRISDEALLGSDWASLFLWLSKCWFCLCIFKRF